MISISKSIFKSDLFSVSDFECNVTPNDKSEIEFLDSFEISFTRSGYFFLNIKKESFDVYTEYIMLGNKDAEYTINHGRNVSDKCTVIKINKDILEDVKGHYWNRQIFNSFPCGNKEHELFPFPVIKSTPQLDNLHFLIYSLLGSSGRNEFPLKVELLILNLIEEIFKEIYNDKTDKETTPTVKERHLETIELAKNFITNNFRKDISLTEISSNVFLSPFHFARIFKKYTGLSPYTYLIQFRLKYASLLLHNTGLSVTEICYLSGFNNFPHFITTFTKYFKINPAAFRKSSITGKKSAVHFYS